MKTTFAIRREDLSKKGEKRVAIVPTLAREIVEAGYPLIVQPRQHPGTGEIKRAFEDQMYEATGASLQEDVSEAQVVFGLKEIEIQHIQANKAYYFFSHTHKGQIKNREMLRKLKERKTTLFDYELVANEKGRVITAFTYFAGYAGMLDSLWTLGKRLDQAGIANPFSIIPQSIATEDLERMKALVQQAGEKIRQEGTPAELPPVINCILGTGKTSQGAQSIYSLLPHKNITLAELPEVFASASRKQVYQLVLEIPDMFRLKQEVSADIRATYARMSEREKMGMYFKYPSRFESNLDAIFPYCMLMMNCILWSPEFPRLMTRSQAKEWYAQHQVLRVVGDITCDPEGAIQFSKETWIDRPVFVYQPASDESVDGFEAEGIAVMAVTNLPCEFSADASAQFSADMGEIFSQMLSADYQAERLEDAGLPKEVEHACILWQGEFTEKFRYMEAYLEA